MSTMDQPLREALASLADTDTVLQGLCGRDDNILLTLGEFSVDAALPVLLFDVKELDDATGQITVEFTACAEGNDAGQTVRALCARVPFLMTGLAFEGEGVPVIPGPALFQSETDNQNVFNVMANREGSPRWHAAVCVLPLLWVPETL